MCDRLLVPKGFITLFMEFYWTFYPKQFKHAVKCSWACFPWLCHETIMRVWFPLPFLHSFLPVLSPSLLPSTLPWLFDTYFVSNFSLLYEAFFKIA